MGSTAPEPVDLGYEYFPLNFGEIRVYEVQKIEHKVAQLSDTTYYQLKEVVGEAFKSGNEDVYPIERYVRENENLAWRLDSVWSARRNAYQAVVVENNISIIKLSFPLEEGRRWDGNAMNYRD